MQAVGWYPNGSGTEANFAGGYLESAASADFGLTLAETGEVINSMDWEALLSYDDGANFESCGSVSLQIIPAPVGPTISNVSLTVGNSSATLSWSTDLTSTGIVNYGTTSGYGSSTTTVSSTSHQATLSGLTASTLYHYQIQVTGTGGTTSTTDATFTTSAANVTTTVTNTVTTTTTATVTVTQTLSDTSSPIISLKTDFSKPFTESPTITGSSADGGTVNAGIASIEYSIDGGKNWLPVDNIEGLGKKSATFEFTPGRLDDGNYIIKMRAKDISGNTGMSKLYSLVIDRLPPQAGGSLFSLGPMIMKPNSNGNIYSIAGLPLKVILSAVGGPITIDLSFDTSTYNLTKNIESGLWSGLLTFANPGSFPLKIKSIDGADNETERTLSTIFALPPGKIIAENGKPISKATVKIYTFEKTLNDFTLWEAEAYMQTNPQSTNDDGEYKTVLPAGKYFLEIEAAGKRKLRTEIFEIDSTTPINQNFTMSNSPFWGHWFSKTIPVQHFLTNTTETKKSPLVGKQIPDFDLSTSSHPFSSTSILGKPSIITFLTSWEPQTSDQLLALDKFKMENTGVNVFAVTVQESVSKTDIFQKTGGYQTPIIADADGVLVLPLSLESLPTHLIVDRKGIIKEVVTGYIDETNLLNTLLK